MNMKISSYLLTVVVGVLLASCHSSEKSASVSVLKGYDSLSVSIDYPFLPSYSDYSGFIREGEIFVGGYNHLTHSFDFISLSGRKNFTLPLEKEGADGVLPVSAFCFQPSCIVLEDESGIISLSYEGKILNRLSFSSAELKNYSMKPSGVIPGSLVHLSAVSDRTMIPLFPRDLRATGLSSYSIGMEYDANSGQFALLPVGYPSGLVSQIQGFQSLLFPGITDSSDRIVYNFPCSAYIYIYDKLTHTTDSILMTSVDIPCELSPLSENDQNNSRNKYEFENVSARFLEPYYDSSSGKYFRFHYGLKSDVFDKNRQAGLVVMDEKDHSLREYRLPEWFSGQYIVAGGTVYMMYRNGEDDSFVSLARIDIKDY